MLHGEGAGNWRIDDVEVFGEEGGESLSMAGNMALPRGRAVPRLDVKAVVSPESLAPWVRERPAGDRLVEHLAPCMRSSACAAVRRGPCRWKASG